MYSFPLLAVEYIIILLRVEEIVNIFIDNVTNNSKKYLQYYRGIFTYTLYNNM